MREKLCIWLAWKLPRQLAYWAFIRVASNSADNPAEWSCADAAKAWDNPTEPK